MTSSSATAFLAVLYTTPAADVEANEPSSSSSSLEEPLLPKGDTFATISKPSALEVTAVLLKRLKFLSFLTGVLVAFLSQYVLSQVLWQNSIMNESSNQVVVFSLLWSFATCLMVFLSMVLFVYIVAYRVLKANDASLSVDARQRWLDAIFQMEAHHIVGALLTISLIWVLIDIFRANPSGFVMVGMTRNISVFTVAFCSYALLCKCLVRKYSSDAVASTAGDEQARNKDSLMGTCQLIASTLGLLAGLCSQFLLSFVLWSKQMTEPLIDNVVIFSMLWSFCTVAFTFLGCLSLRLLTIEDKKSEKTFLHMESYYVFFSLIGICVAWILIDVVLDMREQIFPSLLMLAMSLVCFGVILHCFPEDQCLSSLQEEVEDSSPVKKNKKSSTLLLV